MVKHSVITTENLTLPNPTVEKYLTVLTATGFLEGSERAQIYNIAPGEKSVPLSIFRDKCSEELAYPGIFLGQKRPENDDRQVDVRYSNIRKSKSSKFQQIE